MTRLSKAGWVLGLIGFALVFPTPPAAAGPAHYDKDSKSFHFTYTFAELPGGVGSVVGTVQKPTTEQDAAVKNLVGKVSDVLSLVTGGKAKIGQLDYVDDIKNADLVISLVGAPASPGWANVSATEGRPGQIVLYYQSLQGQITQNIVFTAAHEICHYIFGLADEYVASNFPNGCPPGTGPGCLMDNYNAGARGFMGRLCANDHNVEPTQRPACKDIVEKFFSDLGVTAGDPPGSTAAVTNASTETSPKVDPRPTIIAAVLAKVRAKRMQDQEKGGAGAGSGSLRTFARNTLHEVVDLFNADNVSKFVLGVSESKIVDMIVKAGEIVPIPLPGGLNTRVFGQIRDEAERLAKEYQDIKQQSTRSGKIKTGLQAFVKDLVKLKQIDTKAFAPSAQRQVIDQLAKDVSRDPQERQLDRLVGVGDNIAGLELSAAEDIVHVLDALGEPGTRPRLDYVNRVRSTLSGQFGIVGRDFSRFGTRRTQIITPDPLPNDRFGQDFYALTQGGVFPYATIRNRSTVQFSRLINRSKIQLVVPTSRKEEDFRPIAARIELPFGEIPSEDPTDRQPVRADIQETLANVFDQLERDRLENLAILVPPLGLPTSVGDQISNIRSRFSAGLNVRIDLVLAGVADIPTELRDAVVDSRGSVLTVTDIDEIGAIAQRLKNEESSGAWVIVPQQGNFAIDQAALLEDPKQRPKAPAPDDVEGWCQIAERQNSSLAGALRTMRSLLVAQTKSETIPPEVRQKLGAATQILDALIPILADPENVADRDEPGSLQTQGHKIIEAFKSAEDVASLKGSLGKNIKLLHTIGQAKDQLSKARKLLDAALKTVRSDEVSNRLNLMARYIQYGGTDAKKNEGAEAEKKRKELADKMLNLRNQIPAADKPPTDAQVHDILSLGPNLRGVAKVLRAYERVLEASMVRSKDDTLPIYKRIDRYDMETRRLHVEMANVEATTNSVTAARIIPDNHSVRLARFYAEGKAELELILGLSQELPRSQGGTRAHPKLRLVSDLGVTVADSSKIQQDTTTSTPSLLVWRAATPPLNPGWYTPIVTFDPEVFEQLRDEQVAFTFSVGSARPNIQLITGLVQNADSNSSGTVKRTEGPAVVEVQVSAASSVLGARISGLYQKIAPGSDPIETQIVEFRDDGTDSQGNAPGSKELFDAKHCDRAANDGIYTAFVPIKDINQPTEFRVFVQADTTDGTARYIGLDDPNRVDDRVTPSDKKPTDPTLRRAQAVSTEGAEGQALKFQRATSVHFRAEP